MGSVLENKKESSSSSSYTIQSNEQILQQQTDISKKVKIIQKQSSSSIKQIQQQIKKQNPKLLKKTQTSNVSQMRRGSIMTTGLKPFKKSSKSLRLLIDQTLNKESDEIQILQQLEEQIQQQIANQSQDSSKNMHQIQIFNGSNEYSMGDQSLNNQSIAQSKKNFQDQLQLIQQIIAQKKFLTNHNELLNQGQHFKGKFNRGAHRKISSQNTQNFNEIKSTLNINSLNIQRGRSSSIANIPACKFGQKNQENQVQKPQQISQDLQNLIQFYEGKIDQKQTALDFYKKKTKEIQYSLDSNKIFLNMVVHDMRNPTNQLEFLVKQTLTLLKEFKKLLSSNQSQNINVIARDNQIGQEEQIVAEGQQIIQQQNPKSRRKKNQSQQISYKNNFNLQQIEQSKIEFTKKLEILRNNQEEFQNQKNQEQKEQAQINEIQQQIQSRIKINQKEIDKYSGNIFDQNFNQLNLIIKDQIINHQNIEKIVNDHIQEIQQQKLEFQEKLKLFEQNIDKEIQNCDQPQKVIQNSTDDLILQIQDQEPRITRDLARKLHLSFNPGLIFLNTLKKQILQQINQKVTNINQIQQQELIRCDNIYQFEILRYDSDQIIENQIQNELQLERQSVNSLEMKIMGDKLDQAISQLENCKYCSVMLLNLINDMMDLAKTEQMKFELNNEFFDVTKTVERAFETLSYFGDQKNIQPKLIIDKQIEIFFKNIKGDENRFSQIFLNFLSNAFKFTPQNGSITLEICKANEQNYLQKIIPQQQQVIAQRKFINQMKSPNQNNVNYQINSQGNERFANQSEENGQRAEDSFDNQIKQVDSINEATFDEYYISFQIRIKDSGMGISQENIGKLFLNFSKLADSQGVNKQGTGLGLSICKTLIEKMGGQVHVESEGSGKGTTFVIKMQSVSKIQRLKEIDDIEQLNSVSIPERGISEELILKQNDVVFHQQKRALEKGIMSSQNFDNNFQEQSIKRLQSKIFHNSSERNDSSKNLFQRMMTLKNNKSPANNQKEQLQDSLDSSQAKQNEQSLIQNNENNQLKVLIINDEFFILQMLIMMVKSKEIYNIDTAQNGYDGFNLVKSNQYDFVICDLNMPVMDGFECCQQIKTFFENYNQQFFLVNSNLEQGNLRPYMIACSALINHQIEQKAIKSGFDLVVESPLTAELLHQIILKSSEHKKKEELKFEQNRILRHEINQGEEEEKQELQQSNGRHSSQQDSQVYDLINNLDQSIRYSQEKKLNRSTLNILSISNSDLDIEINNSHESFYLKDQIHNMFVRRRNSQLSKDNKESQQQRISCNIQEKIEEEDDEVSYSNDSNSKQEQNIVLSDELILQLKNSTENNEVQEDSAILIKQSEFSPSGQKSKESLMMKIINNQPENQILKSAISMVSQSCSEQSSIYD